MKFRIPGKYVNKSSVLTLQILNSHYEKKKLRTVKNLLVLIKSLLVTIART